MVKSLTPLQLQILDLRFEASCQWELWKFHGEKSVKDKAEVNYKMILKTIKKLEERK